MEEITQKTLKIFSRNHSSKNKNKKKLMKINLKDL